jgi:hypothetical protein
MRESAFFPIVALLATAVVGMPAAADAAVFSVNGVSYTTEFNTGSGPDNALMVLEYGSGATYLFGYSWDEATTSPSGEDMLKAVAAESTSTPKTLTFVLQAFSFGDAFDSIQYDGHNVTTDINDPNSPYFAYFSSDNGAALDWAPTGAGDRTLLNNSIDDWIYAQPFPADVTASFAVTTAPEPASLSLLGVAGIMLMRRRRS